MIKIRMKRRRIEEVTIRSTVMVVDIEPDIQYPVFFIHERT